jgi:hypothetical protein
MQLAAVPQNTDGSGGSFNTWYKSVDIWSCAGLNSNANCYTSQVNPPLQ